jgi:hypothetical protein
VGPAIGERESGSWAAGGDWAESRSWAGGLLLVWANTRKRKRVPLGWNKGEKRGIGRYVWGVFRDFCDFENHTSTKNHATNMNATYTYSF